MRTFKSILIIFFAVALIASVWVSSIFAVPKITLFVEKTLLCQKDSETSTQKIDKHLEKDCIRSVAELGATGDLFGAINSLFTGLALFAVAVTLWIDSKARRQSLKPLVISVADKDFFIIDDPKIFPDSSLKIQITPFISNIVNETALNVSLFIALEAEEMIYKFPEKIYETPLVHGVNLPIEIVHVISGDFLSKFLNCLTVSNGSVKIVLETKYENLENVRWSTEVRYILDLHNSNDIAKLNAIREKAHNTQALWSNSAVALKSAVVTGSWKRSLVKD